MTLGRAEVTTTGFRALCCWTSRAMARKRSCDPIEAASNFMTIMGRDCASAPGRAHVGQGAPYGVVTGGLYHRLSSACGLRHRAEDRRTTGWG